MDNVFGNVALNYGFRVFLRSKEYKDGEDFNSFFCNVIRVLVLIYGETDIINAYKMDSFPTLIEIVTKYGFKESDFNDLLNNLQTFYDKGDNLVIATPLFIDIQKRLIDMFALKRKQVKVTDDEILEFSKLLYLKEDITPIKKKLYDLYTPNNDCIRNYLDYQMYNVSHKFTFTEYRDLALNKDAYQLAGFNANEILNMSDEEITNINNKVYHFFRIKENDVHKKSHLDEAVSYYKKYGNTITSGSGTVDLLLLLSIVATILLVIIVIGISMR